MKVYRNNFCHILLLTLTLLLAPCAAMAEEEDILTLPQEYYEKAQREYGKQQWNKGKEIVDAGLKRFPDDTNLHTLAGKYWLHLENYDKARFHLVKAVNHYYNNVEAKQMLVSVEDITGNYSSAICYINELLEINPYWEGLWRKKIELYKKQGNTYEATRLFKRLRQIYPKNQEIKNAYYYELEQEYVKFSKEGNLIAKGEVLRELVNLDPKNVDYQLALINHYYSVNLMQRAIDQASIALGENPGNIMLLRKKVGILEENGQHDVAIERVKAFMNNGYNTPEARKLYNELMIITARKGRQDDPYVIYGQIFAQDKNNREALDYLINTAITQRYDQDAIYYLREGKRVYGLMDKKIRYKEYDFYRARGDVRHANALLDKLYQDFPEDYDIAYLYCTGKLEKSDLLMTAGNYKDALVELRKAETVNVDPELTQATQQKLFTSLLHLQMYEQAAEVFEFIRPSLTVEDAILKESMLLSGMGKKDEALQRIYNAIDHVDTLNTEGSVREYYLAGAEELAVPYVKELTETGLYEKAYGVAQQLLKYDYINYYGLLYSINLAGHLGKHEEFDKYTALATAAYPDDYVFTIKQAAIHDRNGEYDQSVALISGKLQQYSGNADYINAYVASSELLALQQSKEDKHADAILTLDNALKYSPNNKTLLYTKGLVYESAHQYDSAYHYQRYFEPSVLETPEYVSKMKGFLFKANKNHVDVEYMQARFSEADVITSVASIGYSRQEGDNTYSARLNYSGRNGDLFWNDVEGGAAIDDGGTGVQLILGATHKFNKRWTGNASLGAGGSYFPKFIANVGATYYFDNDWYVDGSAGFRHLRDSGNLISLSAAGSKVLPSWLLTVGGGAVVFNSELFFNLHTKARYTPLADARTSITAAAGIGTAPELNIIDLYSLSGSFSHMNTFASLGGQYLITPNLSIGLLGVWNTIYDQKLAADGTVATQYRNLYNTHVQIFISF